MPVRKDGDITCLTPEQVWINLKNLCKIMKIPEPVKLFDGNLKISKEDVDKYKLKNLKVRADKYEFFESLDQFYFIVIYSDKFDFQHFESCDWFEHLFKKFVYGTNRPKVYICSATIIDQTKYKTIPRDLLTCPYRLVRIQELHPLIGSENGLESFILDYELLTDCETRSFNNRDYPDILDSDPVVKIVNALPGELIRARMIYSDKGNVFTTFKIRRVIKNKSSLGFFDKSGVDNVEIEDVE